jgi:VWFA-related protein
MITLALAAGASLLGEPQLSTYRSGVDVVNFGVTVTDRQGNLVTDLRPEDFEVLEDGEKQVLTYFLRGDEIDSVAEMHLGLLFDTSGSMGEDIQLSRSAAVRFLNTFPDANDMTLVDFDTEVRLARYGQRDFPRMVERIRSRKPEGWTSLFDALGLYLDSAAEDDGRTILLLYTDGGDTRSTLAFGDVMTLVRSSDVTIYSIGFLMHQSDRSRLEQRARLQQISEATGGQAFFPIVMKDVEAAYEKVAAQVRAQYGLGYVSSNTTQDGRWRKVEIKILRPGLRNPRIYTRKGYFAPYREAAAGAAGARTR